MKKVSDIGERGLIDNIYTQVLGMQDSEFLFDDCAVIDLDHQYLLVTTDLTFQKTHFLKQMSPWQMGWFLSAVNLSDIAAKGGKPIGLVTALGIPNTTDERVVLDIMKGAQNCAKHYGTQILGGDTKETEDITLCATALGLVDKKEFMPRIGAKVGDVIGVTGSLGKAAAGYLAVKNKMNDQRSLRGLFEPNPRVKEGRLLAQQQRVTCCMDISDGLSSSLYQLQQLNSVGFCIIEERLPIDPGLQKLGGSFSCNVSDKAIHFGGDYELLFTSSQQDFSKIQQAFKDIETSVTCIGKVTKSLDIVLDTGEEIRILDDKGYEHFTQKSAY